MKGLRCILLLLILVLGVNQAGAQIEIISEHEKERKQLNKIPFELINNQIIIELTLKHNLKAKFLLDTGVNTSIITEPLISSFLDLEFIRDIDVRGYGREEVLLAYVATNFNFELNERYKYKDRPVIVLKEALSLSEYVGEPIFGIIGYDIFKDYKIELNYRTKSMRFLTSKKPFKKRKFETFKLDMIGNKPYFPVVVSDEGNLDTLTVLIDTGFSGALSMFPKAENEHFIQKPYIPNYRGEGINGAITSTFKKLDKVEFGKFEMREVATNFLDSASLINFNPNSYNDGGLGGEILRRFRIVLDYPNAQVSLRKNRAYKNNFNYNIAGIRIRGGDVDIKDKIIDHVRLESPSALAGLKPFDKILSIDDKSVKYMNYDKIYGLMNNLEKPKKRITVERKEEILTFEFLLQDIF